MSEKTTTASPSVRDREAALRMLSLARSIVCTPLYIAGAALAFVTVGIWALGHTSTSIVVLAVGVLAEATGTLADMRFTANMSALRTSPRIRHE